MSDQERLDRARKHLNDFPNNFYVSGTFRKFQLEEWLKKMDEILNKEIA